MITVVLWREPGGEMRNENSRWSDIDLSPCLTLCYQTNSACLFPSKSVCALTSGPDYVCVPSSRTQTLSWSFSCSPGTRSQSVSIVASPSFCFSLTDGAYKHQAAASLSTFQSSQSSVMCNDWSSACLPASCGFMYVRGSL